MTGELRRIEISTDLPPGTPPARIARLMLMQVLYLRAQVEQEARRARMEVLRARHRPELQ